MKKIFVFIILASCVFASVGSALAGGVRYPCNNPLVFEGADINNYIRAFDGISGSVTRLDTLGAEVSLLIQFDALYSQVGLGRIGAVQLVPEVGDHVCSDESIMDKLLGKADGARGQVKKGGGIILFSGRFEIVDEEVYLISRIEFVRKGQDERILLPRMEGSGASPLVGMLPRNDITFSPRKLSKQELVDISNAYDRYIRVHRKQSEDDKGERINASGSDVAAFFIKDISQGWLKIEWYGTRSTGYVKVPERVGQFGLRELMPELYFMEATAVYLSLMVREEDFSEEDYQTGINRFDKLRNTFERHCEGRSDREALALLDAMSGFLYMAKAVDSNKINEAANRFARTAEQMPANTNALMLNVLGQYAKTVWKPNLTADTLNTAEILVTEKLVQLIKIDPLNDVAKQNYAIKVKKSSIPSPPNNLRILQ